MTDRKTRMEISFQKAFSPALLEVVNQSASHKGHAGDDGSAETHFDVTIVSENFAGMSRPARHRAVYALLDEEFKTGLHALALRLLTPSEMSAV
jgi:BolA family transcriptional regulator, general stress-responsive regulator